MESIKILSLVSLLFSTCISLSNNNHNHNECLDYDYDEINTQTEIIDNTNYGSTNATFYSYTNDLDFYFSNLQGNMGRNVKGTCGYIALCMLLSYYDSYFNDSIIPETYDINNVESATVSLHNRSESPGVLCENIADTYIYGSDSSYNNIMYSYINVSLHAKLLHLNNNNYGTSYTSRYNVLSNFLSNVANFSNYSIDGINYGSQFNNGNAPTDMSYYSTQVRNYIISQIQNGKPVLVGATNASLTSHHAFIIYGYNSSNDSFYANMGWGYGNSRVVLNSNSFYSYFKSAMVLNITSSHSHSNNYVSRSSYGDQYNFTMCGCSYSGHTHNYTFAYVQNNKNKHKAYCSCSSYCLEVHFFDFDTNTCIYCNYHNNIIMSEGDDHE